LPLSFYSHIFTVKPTPPHAHVFERRKHRLV
jgi:hypothetical protein